MKNPSGLDIGSVVVVVIILITYFTLERAKFPEQKLPFRRTVLVILAALGILVFVFVDYFFGGKGR